MARVKSVEGMVCGLNIEFRPAARAKRRTGRQASAASAWQQRGSSVRPPGGLVQVDYSSVIAPVGSARYKHARVCDLVHMSPNTGLR